MNIIEVHPFKNKATAQRQICAGESTVMHRDIDGRLDAIHGQVFVRGAAEVTTALLTLIRAPWVVPLKSMLRNVMLLSTTPAERTNRRAVAVPKLAVLQVIYLHALPARYASPVSKWQSWIKGVTMYVDRIGVVRWVRECPCSGA